MSIQPLPRFISLFHHRWAVPILVELHRDGGCKFVTLANRLEVSRDSLTRTLTALVDRGWVMRNPGYGHPMRPEYILTSDGEQLAPWCARFLEVLGSLGLEEIAFRKWPIAVALAVQQGHERFTELSAFLPGVTARALALALKALQEEDLVERVVSEEYPPVPRYRLTERGKSLVPLFERGPALGG